MPPVIKEKAKIRDILEYKIKIKNLGNTLYHFYTFVEDLEEEKNLNKSTSLAKWVEIFRGRTEILPNEEKEISLIIRIPSFAEPGNYFAQIVFAQGATEIDAREKAKSLNMPKALLAVEIEENIVEKIQVKKFQTGKKIYFQPNIKFEIELGNIGNKDIEPEGKILIYDKKGKEISALELEKKKILAGNTEIYEIFWKTNKSDQFKAILFGEYGKNKEKFFQDTTFFWVIQWQFLLLFLFLVFIFLMIIILTFLKKIKSYYKIFKHQKFFDIFKK